jgi:hypothetical protein
VHVVGRAIERINDPTEARTGMAGLPHLRLPGRSLSLFAYETVIGKSLRHDAANLSLRGKIGLRHQVARPFPLGAKPAHPIQENRPARPGRLLADCERIGGIDGEWSIHAGVARRGLAGG